jgi:uncharacterized membrane protein YdbT with pleckstrin-like domain
MATRPESPAVSDPEELRVWEVHVQPGFYLNRLILGVLGALVGLILAWIMSHSPRVWYAYPFLALSAASLGLLAWVWLACRTTTYRLTTQRLRRSMGILNRRIDDIELYRVRDTVLEQPFGLRMIGLGNILVLSSDPSTPRMTLYGVHSAEALRESIRLHVERVRNRLGIRAMDWETISTTQ